MVAAVVGSPGTPKRIEVMSPVVASTDAMPRRMAKASTGFILTMKGSISAMVAGPPSPGRMPTANPTAIPTIISEKVDQVKICVNPETKEVSNSNIGNVPRAKYQLASFPLEGEGWLRVRRLMVSCRSTLAAHPSPIKGGGDINKERTGNRHHL